MEHGGKVFIGLLFLVHHQRALLGQELREEAQGRNLQVRTVAKTMNKQTLLNWLASSCLCLAQLSHITWDYLPSGGTTHSVLGPSTAPTDMPPH